MSTASTGASRDSFSFGVQSRSFTLLQHNDVIIGAEVDHAHYYAQKSHYKNTGFSLALVCSLSECGREGERKGRYWVVMYVQIV